MQLIGGRERLQILRVNDGPPSSPPALTAEEATMAWSVRLLSTECVRKLLQNSTDRDPDQEFGAHRYRSYLVNSAPVYGSLDPYPPPEGDILIHIDILKPPWLAQVDDAILVSMYTASRHVESDGARKYYPAVDFFVIPWIDTASGQIGEAYGRHNFTAEQIAQMRDIIAAAEPVTQEEFEQKKKTGYKKPEEATTPQDLST